MSNIRNRVNLKIGIRFCSIAILVFSQLSCGNKTEKDLDAFRQTADSLRVELYKSNLQITELQNKIEASKPKVFYNENFDSFFWDFMTDSVFQRKRIKFPLSYITWKDEIGGEIDTLKVEAADWKYNSFYINTASERTQIYDNFQLKLNPSNKRVVHWYGVETGGDSKYFFQGFKGQWFLVRKEQLGD